MGNKKRSKSARWGAEFTATLYTHRNAISLVSAYLAVFFWLMFGHVEIPDSSAVITEGQEVPQWTPPGRGHLFGTTASGLDLFAVARRGMATSASFAITVSALGVGFALLSGWLIAYTSGAENLRFAARVSEGVGLVPAFFILLVLSAGTRGDPVVLLIGFSILIGFLYMGQVHSLFAERQGGGDLTAALALGMSRTSIVTKRDLPSVAAKCFGIFSVLIPLVMLTEMTLSFLGLMGDRISCGRLIAEGGKVLVEAPWLSVYPGIMATVIVIIFALLGWCVSGVTKCKPMPRAF